MTEKEKRLVLDMRAEGKPYKEISETLGIDVSTLKVFIHRNKQAETCVNTVKRRCISCQKPLRADARRTQRFCCEKCRNDWWNHHQEQLSGGKRTVYVCEVCGKQFSAYKKARYCSRACYLRSLR